ncbi:IQ calmodulin-binding motif containing protein, putative [Angomonas deanei]|uniref:IQ calmodulin-binding motif containing protein, putative n=1 Tax=Angomonas deanei TaxID=59799 RepID=A0A7G2CAU1_9TRYP|nr:IQ calmodulin-binding motif containing protein, putative [Angomonas deanei]
MELHMRSREAAKEEEEPTYEADFDRELDHEDLQDTEADDNAARDKAAVDIQRVTRGWLARKNKKPQEDDPYRELGDEPTLPLEGDRVDEPEQEDEEDYEAQRRAHEEQTQAALKLQSFARMVNAKKQYEEELRLARLKAAEEIQAKQTRSTTEVQRVGRGYIARRGLGAQRWEITMNAPPADKSDESLATVPAEHEDDWRELEEEPRRLAAEEEGLVPLADGDEEAPRLTAEEHKSGEWRELEEPEEEPKRLAAEEEGLVPLADGDEEAPRLTAEEHKSGEWRELEEPEEEPRRLAAEEEGLVPLADGDEEAPRLTAEEHKSGEWRELEEPEEEPRRLAAEEEGLVPLADGDEEAPRLTAEEHKSGEWRELEEPEEEPKRLAAEEEGRVRAYPEEDEPMPLSTQAEVAAERYHEEEEEGPRALADADEEPPRLTAEEHKSGVVARACRTAKKNPSD